MSNPYTDDSKDRKAAMEMDTISKTVFAKVYPLIARQILVDHKICAGTCIDLGSGPGTLSICLAQITDLQIFALDQSRHSHAIATANIREQGLEKRITPVTSDICDLPFGDNYADLMVSRGSIFFWQDLKGAFNEIYRVLKPGGKTHIGGGFGSKELKVSIFEQMAKKGDSFARQSKDRMSPETLDRIKTALDNSHASRYTISHSGGGFWIHITKEEHL